MEDMREDKDYPEENKKPEDEAPFEEEPEGESEKKTKEESEGEPDKAKEETSIEGESGTAEEEISMGDEPETAREETSEKEESEEVSEKAEPQKAEEETKAQSEEAAKADKPEGESSESEEEKPDEAKEEAVTEAGKAEEEPENDKMAEEGSAAEEGGSEETESEETEPKAKRHYGKFILAAAAAVVAIGAAAYIGYAQQFNTKFFPRTTVNHIDVSSLPIEDVKDKLAEGVADYRLNIVSRTGDEELSGKDIGLEMVYDDSLEDKLAEQNPYLWGLHLFQDTPYTIDTMVSYDSDLMNRAISNLDCMDPLAMTAPIDASISDYDEETGTYSIIPEIPGTIIVRDNLAKALDEAVISLNPELVLADADVYAEADVTSENEELLALLDEYNKYAGMTVIYHFGDEEEILDGSRLHDWLSTAGDGSVTVDRDAVAEYVKYLAGKYDTTSQPRTLQTSYGSTVTLTKGNYGWKISQSKETDALVDILLSGEGEEREPVYQQTAVTRGEKDFGDTYVEINLTAQHLYYYKNGSLVIESDLVSGNESNGNATPDGAYYVAYKQRNAVLRGQRRADGSYEYESLVSYWMPFNGGIGLHDATWRGSFGGSIYKTNGSHGCINLPFSVAKTIFENIDAGTPVFCYRLGSTEPTRTATSGSSSGSRSSSGSSSSASSAAAQTPQPVTEVLQVEESAPVAEAVEIPAETGNTSGSSNVIVAGQSKIGSGPGAQQPAETSPVITAGSSSAETQAAPVETQAAPAEAQAAPAETQAAPAETQAAPVETQAAPPQTAAAVEAAPVAEAVPVEAPGQ